MKKMNENDFNKVEELVLTDACFVEGKAHKKGDKVKVSGNAKIQLLASQRAERVAEVKEVKK